MSEVVEKPDSDIKNDVSLKTIDAKAYNVSYGENIKTNIDITTDSTDRYDLSKLKVRYYFNGDKAESFKSFIYGGINYTVAPWYAPVNASVSFNKEDNAKDYAEISFEDGVLNNKATMKIDLTIAKNDWTRFEGNNDVSKVLVYYEDKVISVN
ncbi:MAG: hypothetical protein K5986_05145 [Clostridium sp.]|uniref:cellulose binding domain-containing protein n=1 Tax=Clostridium sp. DSM 8431 TaxID=1761781 RepID=UPI0008E2BF17|nr:cellulose binding domain-containing protein [Clostridium sp. DSM 8431]MCR4943835.1 hypothetical protein [Clostridium sp.]SFU48062.1 Cellulose binding domain-containing protein [Clostridium sp. DSM 8431]